MTQIDHEARVRKGIALIDEKFPGFFETADFTDLNIAIGTHCVTAKLAGWRGLGQDYMNGMHLLGLSADNQNVGSYTDHGFNAEINYHHGAPSGYDYWDAIDTLNAIWRREIAARLNGDAS